MQLRSLDWKDPLKEDMATHSSILAWRIPMDRGAWWGSWGSERARHDEMTNTTHQFIWASLVAQTIENLPAVQENWVQSLGQEDLLKKGMATYSSILA